MQQQPVRIGIVGCGAVMEHYMLVAAELAARGEARVVLACDTDEGKREQMRARHAVERFTTDFRAVAADPEVDLVLGLAPVVLHAPIALAALAAGKHVLLEKTIAGNAEDAAQVVEAARRGPGRLLCAPHVLLSPTYQTIWRRVKRGEIGRVLTARARYGWADPFWQGPWIYGPGGGALFEFAVYNVTSLTGLLGPVRRVAAASAISIPEREIGGRKVRVESEDNAHVLLDFGGGVLAAVTTSFTFQRYRSPAIELYGAEGTVQLLGDDWAPAGHELWRNDEGCWQLFEEDGPTWPWADGLRHLVGCIRSGEAPISTPEHAAHVLDVLLAARRASAEGRTIDVESRFAPPAIPETPTTEERPS